MKTSCSSWAASVRARVRGRGGVRVRVRVGVGVRARARARARARVRGRYLGLLLGRSLLGEAEGVPQVEGHRVDGGLGAARLLARGRGGGLEVRVIG